MVFHNALSFEGEQNDHAAFAAHVKVVGTPGGLEVVEVVDVDDATLGRDGHGDGVVVVGCDVAIIERRQVDETVGGGLVVCVHDVAGRGVQFLAGVLAFFLKLRFLFSKSLSFDSMNLLLLEFVCEYG